MRTILTLVAIYIAILANAQSNNKKQANIWYFGDHAGLDFNSGSPVVLTDGALSTFEGVASICNAQGQILFYTDGMTVYNRHHNVMQNGTGLNGHSSSTQSGVIVPLPLSTSKYYIFTVDFVNSSGTFSYSIVDITADGGNGAVIQKNTFIQDNSAEKISAVVHANGMDIWVVIHERRNSIYKSYLLTKDGLSTTVKTSNTGPSLGINAEQGYLKISPNGQYLAMATYWDKRLDISSFDHNTGTVTSLFSKYYPDATYGVEFSPDSRKAYVSISYDLFQLYQIDLATQAEKLIATPPKAQGALQLGPDEKIYVSHYVRPTNSDKYLGVINDPNADGVACNYVDQAIHLGTAASFAGLPTFIQSYFNYAFQINGTNACANDTSFFSAELSTDLLNTLQWLTWNFNDPYSTNNTSTDLTTWHIYSIPGMYNATLTFSSNNIVLSGSILINVYAEPILQLPDTSYTCPGEDLRLSAGPGFYSYSWNTGNTDSVQYVNTEGQFWVEKTSIYGCSSSDTTLVVTGYDPVVNIPDSLIICPGDSLLLDAGDDQFTYKWSTEASGSSIWIKDEGLYWVDKINSINCSARDSAELSWYSVPEIDLGADTALCEEDGILLMPLGFDSYLWHDSSTFSTYLATEPGIYYVVATTENNCKVSDSIEFTPCCRFTLNYPNAFTPNDDGINDTFKAIITGATSYRMSIFNRWGALLYTSINIDEAWNGTFKENKCPEGAYVVMFEYIRCDNPDQRLLERKYGSVALIR